jgi:hypothetical protein
MTSKTSTARGLVSLHLPFGLGTMSCPTTHWLRASQVQTLHSPGRFAGLANRSCLLRFRGDLHIPSLQSNMDRISARAHSWCVPGEPKAIRHSGECICLRIAHLSAGGAPSRFANRTFAGRLRHSQTATPERRADLRIAHLSAGGAPSRFANRNVEQSCAFLRFRGDHAHSTPANHRGLHQRIEKQRLVCTWRADTPPITNTHQRGFRTAASIARTLSTYTEYVHSDKAANMYTEARENDAQTRDLRGSPQRGLNSDRDERERWWTVRPATRAHTSHVRWNRAKSARHTDVGGSPLRRRLNLEAARTTSSVDI